MICRELPVIARIRNRSWFNNQRIQTTGTRSIWEEIHNQKFSERSAWLRVGGALEYCEMGLRQELAMSHQRERTPKPRCRKWTPTKTTMQQRRREQHVAGRPAKSTRRRSARDWEASSRGLNRRPKGTYLRIFPPSFSTSWFKSLRINYLSYWWVGWGPKGYKRHFTLGPD